MYLSLMWPNIPHTVKVNILHIIPKKQHREKQQSDREHQCLKKRLRLLFYTTLKDTEWERERTKQDFRTALQTYVLISHVKWELEVSRQEISIDVRDKCIASLKAVGPGHLNILYDLLILSTFWFWNFLTILF